MKRFPSNRTIKRGCMRQEEMCVSSLSKSGSPSIIPEWLFEAWSMSPPHQGMWTAILKVMMAFFLLVSVFEYLPITYVARYRPWWTSL